MLISILKSIWTFLLPWYLYIIYKVLWIIPSCFYHLTVLLCLSACTGESANSSGTTVRHTRIHTCACTHRRAHRHTALDSSTWQRLVTHETPSESVDSELPRWEASQPVTLSCALPGDEGGERRDPPVTLTLCPEESCPHHCSLSYSWARMYHAMWWALCIWALGELCSAFSRFPSTYYSWCSFL